MSGSDDDDTHIAEDEYMWEREMQQSKQCAAETQERACAPSHPKQHNSMHETTSTSDAACHGAMDLPVQVHRDAAASAVAPCVPGRTQGLPDTALDDDDAELVIDGVDDTAEKDDPCRIPFLWPSCLRSATAHAAGEDEEGYNNFYTCPPPPAPMSAPDADHFLYSTVRSNADRLGYTCAGQRHDRDRSIHEEERPTRSCSSGSDRGDEVDEDTLELERVLARAHGIATTTSSCNLHVSTTDTHGDACGLTDNHPPCRQPPLHPPPLRRAESDVLHSPLFARLLRDDLGICGGRFRPRQEEVCWHVLCGRSTLVVCPTGWGKSLCYQFPMLLHRLRFRAAWSRWQRAHARPRETTRRAVGVGGGGGGADTAAMPPTRAHPLAPPVSQFCVVISPLLSLMMDQAEKMQRRGALRSVTLSGQTSATRLQSILTQLSSPLCSIDVVFISPEKFTACGALQAVLSAQLHRVALLCIDEVHCVSRWAHDFRPTFMYIHRVVHDVVARASRMGGTAAPTRRPPPFLCLTATATQPVMRQLQRRFAIVQTIVCDEARTHLQLQSVDMSIQQTPEARGRAGDVGHTRDDRSTHETHTWNVCGAHTGVGERHECEPSRHELVSPSHTEDEHVCASASQTSMSARTVTVCLPPTTRAVQEAVWAAVQSLPSPTLIYVRSRNDADELASYLTHQLGGGRVCGGAPPTAGIFRRANHAGFLSTRPTEHPHSPHTAHTRPDKQEQQALEEDKAGRGRRTVRSSCVVRSYHAGLSTAVRTRTQRQFLRNEVDVLVATVAFGMGIDKPNIRSVIHACVPPSVESYVQEIGRAGRDGEPSVCRLLYNPFDYYELRNRLLASSWLSCREVTQVVQCLLHDHSITRGGGGAMRCTVVSPAVVATRLELAEEVVETLLFMMLAPSDEEESEEDDEEDSTEDAKNGSAHMPHKWSRVFVGLCGTCPLGYRTVEVMASSSLARADGDMTDLVTSAGGPMHHKSSRHPSSRTQTSAEVGEEAHLSAHSAAASWDVCAALAPTHADNEEEGNKEVDKTCVTLTRQAWSTFGHATKDTTCTPTPHTAWWSHVAGRGEEAVAAVSDVLSQLHVCDAVLERCRRPHALYDLVEDANALGLSLTTLRTRLVQLVRRGALLLRRPRPNGYVVCLAKEEGVWEAAMSPAGTAALGRWLWRRYEAHVRRQRHGLALMMRVLRQPTHERLRVALQTGAGRLGSSSSSGGAADNNEKTREEEEMAAALPARGLTRVAAVSVANAFVAEHRLRIGSTQEAARALLGVVPRSVIKRGKFAGQLPLAQSWYIKSPYFGALREFDPDWVLSVLAVHHLDDPAESTT